MAVGTSDYELHKEKVRRRTNLRTAAGQELGRPDKPCNYSRRGRARRSFAYFCETYFPATFTLPWAEYHYRAATKIQRAVMQGGLFAFAMPRGSGKSVMSRWAALWAVLTGRCSYVVIIGATEKEAARHIEQIKTELRTNDLLAADFRWECHGIRRLGRSARRAEGQKYKGEPTCIEWKANRIVLPWIPEKPCLGSGSVIESFGLTGSIRGVSHTRPDGTTIRPGLAICDDPQTRESAKSASQSFDREQVIIGDVAYLAGPGQPIAVLMPCTVICEGDLSDRLLNQKLHPEWQGERVALVESFPSNVKRWDEYADMLRNSGDDGYALEAATKFYAKHRLEMDEGATVSWPQRHLPSELSAIQHAMNLKIRSEPAFWAEYQNQPMPERADLLVMDRDAMAANVSGYGRGLFPAQCSTLTAFVDVQGTMLYWLVAAWQDDFTGFILDYGSHPDQGRRYFTLADASRTLKREYRGCDDEAAIFRGLSGLFQIILGREWIRDDAAPMRINRCMVDANWGNTSVLVNQCCRQSPFANILTPSYGRGIKASQKPISEWMNARGRRCGPEWLPTKAQGTQLVGVIYDANYWKKRWHEAFALPPGTRSAIKLFAAPTETHRMFADHAYSELPKKTEHAGRVVYEWPLKPGMDNHLYDCAVGAMVAASLCGVCRSEATPVVQTPVRRRAKVNYL